ncbi:MAG TPA: acetate--CoA ligase family protein [Acidimicrobiia bacterium]|jgi:acetyl-CoA synthetase (ADP-forming)|nr:acetate--CoA ligase family protein [Acidimicrobiia bacterium]
MGRTLAEHESLALLRERGVPVVEEAVVDRPDEAAAAATRVGFPVVVKLTGAGLAHKSERGLLRLGLRCPADVEAAAAELLAAAGPDDGAVRLVVAPMVAGSRELLAGAYQDPQFGPCVLVGVGGVLAEALDDVAVRLAPIEARDGHEMLDDLRAAAILGPFRGEPAVDRERLVAILLALSELVTTRPDVAAVDVNPLVVVDGRPVAVDALVELRT